MTVATIGPLQVLRTTLFSTHHASADDALTGRERPFTAPGYALLIGRARRFTSLVTQMHIEVCGALKADITPETIAVFATCHGEIQTAENLVADFRQAQMVSSARFAMSVHNTASGVYSVAMGSTAPSTTVTGANAIAAGWLEAALTALEAARPVLLSIADEPVPAMFQGPSQPVGVAAAFLLGPASPAAGAGRRAELAIALCDEPRGEPAEVDSVAVLGRAVAALGRSGAATIRLGHIQPGRALDLHLPAGDGRAP